MVIFVNTMTVLYEKDMKLITINMVV